MSTNKARQAALAIEREADRRVAAGAALLDEKVPGWRGKIDLETLNIADGHSCALAQVSGSTFNDGLAKYHIAGAPQYGFSIYDRDEVSYAALNEAWARALAA